LGTALSGSTALGAGTDTGVGSRGGAALLIGLRADFIAISKLVMTGHDKQSLCQAFCPAFTVNFGDIGASWCIAPHQPCVVCAAPVREGAVKQSCA
jgi:hypothetical protein